MYEKEYYTPDDVAWQIVQDFRWRPGEIVHEPCLGDGAFYCALPDHVITSWSEIEEGRDFFAYRGPCHTIITNPPHQHRGDNMVIRFLEHSFQVAKERVIFLLDLRGLNTLTPPRLQQYADAGWAITSFQIRNIPKWSGRYFVVAWTKGGRPIISWAT